MRYLLSLFLWMIEVIHTTLMLWRHQHVRIERSWKWWRQKNLFGKTKIYFSHIPNLFGWLFCIAAGKRYYLLQIQLQRNRFMTNRNKNIFSFVKHVFTTPSIQVSVNFFWPLQIFCANVFVINLSHSGLNSQHSAWNISRCRWSTCMQMW